LEEDIEMNRKLVFSIIAILLVTSGCTVSLFGNTAPTATAVANPPISPLQPTVAAPVTANTQPAAASSVSSTATATSGCPASYNGNFVDSAMANCWGVDKPLTITSKAPALMYITYNNGALDFTYKTTESYGYVVYDGGPYNNGVVFSVVAASLQSTSGAIVLACNMTDTQWFETRISTSGEYAVYRYSTELRAATGNAYSDYVDAMSPAIKAGYQKVNNITISCIGSEFILTVNGAKLFDQQLPEMKPGGYIGVGAISHDKYPVQIRFTSFTVEPQ
jgi:hypothetical protein